MTKVPAPHDRSRTVYTVSELNASVRELLEHSFPLLWVEGEISNLAKPRSGHWYFSLKDDNAQVRCAMFRNKNQLLRFAPENGMQVTLRAKISLYPARGDYQMIVEHMEEAGAGALQRAFEQLKAKLEAEGLFDEALKRPLPKHPRRIGVITSATGAALHDVLSVLRRRYPLGQVLLHPVAVQGAAAAPAICQALATASQRDECDVLLLVRGGGSLEDLWAFNEESVARAINACAIPVVTGIGHEVDTSIADYAADLRAPTPTAAAELVCPDQRTWQQHLDSLQQRLARHFAQGLKQNSDILAALEARLRRLHPERRLQEQNQRLDDLEQRLQRTLRWRLQHQRDALTQTHTRLQAVGPRTRIASQGETVKHLQTQLSHLMRRRLQQDYSRWQVASRSLNAVSPLNTLERGYAIATTEKNQVLTTATDAQSGDKLMVTLHRGRLQCEVLNTFSQADTNSIDDKQPR